MKKLLSILSIAIVLGGCGMGRDKMKRRFHQSTTSAYKQMLKSNHDSAMFFMGQQQAFYECIYNKKP